uniref:Uncharacterized protein n=1 Tax=Alexandrium catenella TaxID=2925 RepID=A0A7S1QMM1_ALECA
MGLPMFHAPQGYAALPRAAGSEAGVVVMGYMGPAPVAGASSPMRCYPGRMDHGGMVHPTLPVPPMPALTSAGGVLAPGRAMQEPFSPVAVSMRNAAFPLPPQAQYATVPALPLADGGAAAPMSPARWPSTLEEVTSPIVCSNASPQRASRPLMATVPGGGGASRPAQSAPSTTPPMAPNMLLQGGAWAPSDARHGQPTAKELESMLLQAMPEIYDD